MLFPNTRSDVAIKRFKTNLDTFGYDLEAWRESLKGVREYEPGFAVLDEHDGWSVLRGCLCEEPKRRITAAKAASSRFCRV